MKKKLSILLSVVVLLSLFLSGCRTAETAVYYGGTVRYAIFDEPKGIFHPLLYTTRNDGLIIENIYSGMLRLNPKMEVEPDLASDFSISDDKRTVTYTLREGLKWHDGEPLTTADVLYTFETIAHPDYKGPQYSSINNIDGIKEFKNGETDTIKGIKIIDERTVEITTIEPFENAPYYIGCQKIIPKHIWEKVPVFKHGSEKELLKSPVGSGPFKLSEYKSGKYIEMAAFDYYYLGRPLIDNLMILIVDKHKAHERLVWGQIDIMEVPDITEDTIEYYKSYDINVETVSCPLYAFLGYNSNKKLLKGEKIPEALSHAINRKGIVQNILNGYGKISLDLEDTNSFNLMHYDLKEDIYSFKNAIELLKQSGWEYRNNTMYYGGKPVKLSLKYAPGDITRERSVLEIKENFEQVGIEIQLEIVDIKTLLEDIEDKNFDLYMHEWLTYEDIFFKVKDRMTSLSKWSKPMVDETPEVFLYSPLKGIAYSESLKGVTIFSFNHFYDVHKWKLS